MKRGSDGRARIEMRDIDLRSGFHAYRWFWLVFAVFVAAWVLS
jgi:hypothetical protein